jgi:hypothetical protein
MTTDEARARIVAIRRHLLDHGHDGWQAQGLRRLLRSVDRAYCMDDGGER